MAAFALICPTVFFQQHTTLLADQCASINYQHLSTTKFERERTRCFIPQFHNSNVLRAGFRMELSTCVVTSSHLPPLQGTAADGP